MPSKSLPLYIYIYEDLLTKINNGTYAVGEKLPSEKELTEKYNVSRITSKKAMELLSSRGFISRMPGRGSFVLKKDFIENTSETVGLNNHKIIGVVIEKISDSFGTQLLLGIEKEAEANGYSIVLKCTYGDRKVEEECMLTLLNMGVCGMVIMCSYDETYNPVILKLAVEDFPIVLVDRQLNGIPVPFVGTDNEKATVALINKLFDLGHEQITFISARSFSASSVSQRLSGFIKAEIEHKIIPDKRLWFTEITSSFPENVYQASENIRKDVNMLKAFILKNLHFTAFFCVSYDIASVVSKAISELEDEGVVTHNITVACFDGPEDVFGNGRFMHIKQSQHLIGTTSIKHLIKKINGEQVQINTYIPFEIIE